MFTRLAALAAVVAALALAVLAHLRISRFEAEYSDTMYRAGQNAAEAHAELHAAELAAEKSAIWDDEDQGA